MTENSANFAFPLVSFCSAVRSALVNDSVLQPLLTNVFYRIADSNATGEFVVQQMKAGAFLEVLAGTSGVRLQWQLEAVAGEREGQSPMQRCDLIANRIYALFDRNEATLQPYLAPIGLYCERSKAINFIPPTLQTIAGAQRWKYGHVYEWWLSPLEEI